MSSSPTPHRARAWAAGLAVVLAYAALALAQTGLWRDPATRVWGGPDPFQDVVILNWVSGHLLAGPSRVFDANIYHPWRDSILFCNPLLGPSALAFPLRVATENPVLLYNAAQLLCLLVASCGFHLLAAHLFRDRRAALLAGAVIPYNAQVAAHYVHLDQMTIAGFPFVLLALLKLLERPHAGWALLLGVAFALQAGTNGYHAWSVLILCLVIAAWGGRRLLAPRTFAAVAAAALLALVLLAPYLLGFLRLRGEHGLERGIETNRPYSVELPGGVLQTHSTLWRRLLGDATLGNRPMFPGAVVLVCAALGLRRWREPRVRLLLAVAAVFFVLALGPELILFGRGTVRLPYAWLFAHVPLFDSMRHPVTFVVPALMALGLLATGGLAASPLPRHPGPLALVLALAVAETLQARPDRVTRPIAAPEVYAWLATQPRGPVLELPFDDHEAQWRAMFHGLPLVNGACGSFAPGKYAALRRLVNRGWSEPRASLDGSRSLAYLKARFPAEYLVLLASAPPAFRANLDATPGSFALVHESATGDRVYRVSRGGEGRLLRRVFRDDQLRAGPLRASLRGPQGAGVRILLNDSLIEERALQPSGEDVRWSLPAERLVRGPNVIRLEQTGLSALAAMELLEIAPAQTP